MEKHLAGAAAGAIAGAVGTTLMMQSAKLGAKLPERAQPTPLEQDPAQFILSKAEQVGGKSLPSNVRGTAAKSLHWTYGIGWSTALGALAPELPLGSYGDAMLAGAGFGAAVWAAGYLGWLPAAGLAAPIHRQGLGHIATGIASHVLYGIACALPMFAMYRAMHPARRAMLRWFF